MPEQTLPPTVFHMLEKNLGKNVRVILDPSYGFEGTLVAVTREPSGIWLSDAEAVVLRATIAQPIPQVASREERSEIFIHLNSVQRIEVLHSNSRRWNIGFQKNTCAKTHITISEIAAATRISGLTLTPSVSSSKNLNNPALAAGIGDESLFFFLLILNSSAFFC